MNVYVIDSGIRRTRQDFQGGVVAAFDVFNDGQNTGDCLGHGTHVARTIGGATYGVAKNASLYAVRVLDCMRSITRSDFSQVSELKNISRMSRRRRI